jgi:hypothetical protein
MRVSSFSPNHQLQVLAPATMFMHWLLDALAFDIGLQLTWFLECDADQLAGCDQVISRDEQAWAFLQPLHWSLRHHASAIRLTPVSSRRR